MKHSILAVALLALAASAAHADSVALDYRATDPSCINASRFADEVSAKLGFVPWQAAASSKIRVRVEKDGKQFSGSVINVDGSSKVIEDATCDAVTSKLALTVAGAIDPASAKPDAPRPAPQPAGQPAAPAASAPAADGTFPVTFASAEGRRIDISLNTGGGYGYAAGKTVVTAYYEGVCTTPCTRRMPQGRHYLTFHDPDSGARAGDAFLIDGPTNLTLQHKSQRGKRIGWLTAGLIVTGASLGGGYVIGGTGGILLASLGGGFGTGMLIMPLLIPDTFTVTRSP